MGLATTFKFKNIYQLFLDHPTCGDGKYYNIATNDCKIMTPCFSLGEILYCKAKYFFKINMVPSWIKSWIPEVSLKPKGKIVCILFLRTILRFRELPELQDDTLHLKKSVILYRSSHISKKRRQCQLSNALLIFFHALKYAMKVKRARCLPVAVKTSILLPMINKVVKVFQQMGQIQTWVENILISHPKILGLKIPLIVKIISKLKYIFKNGVKNLWRRFLIGRTHFCTTNLGIWYFFDQETYIHFLAQETSIIIKLFIF